jgi:hypothetical protein
MEKLDLSKVRKELYRSSVKATAAVDVPAMNFLMVDGRGDPNTSQDFQDGMMALYGVAYTLKFGLKKGLGMDWKIMPLEGLWWMENMAEFDVNRKDDWLWTLMVAQPDFIIPDQVEAAMEEVRRKRNPVSLSKVRFERFHEGLAAQILHIGPYNEEHPNNVKLHAFIEESGHKLRGKHHEIYLSDPCRTPAEKWNTIIRQPFE